ncbi:hypothetical protein V8F06_009869 [Rhypophila decipiens]
MDSPNPEQELPSTIDIVSTIGTWAAVILALVALLGIIGPYLALRSAQSDRSQALKRVDSGSSGFLKTFKITESLAVRTVRVPILHGVPNEEDSPKLKYVISGEAGTFPDEEILPISKTGWVNLANLASVYIDKVPRGDSLVIRQQNSWLPVNRFIILAMGLCGRYGHRVDRGERLDTQTRARLFTETLDTGEEEAYLNTQTAGKIFGTTGIIWWRQTLGQNEARSDEVCFAPHPEPLLGRHTIDPTPLDELFWLAIGCLPVRDESRKEVWVVYDLNYEIRRAHRTTTRRTESPIIQTLFFKSRDSLSPRHLQWAAPMGVKGITSEKVKYLDIQEVPRDNTLRFARLDQETIAVGVLRLRPSPNAFLMLPGCNILSPYLLEGSAKSRFRKAASIIPKFDPDESISEPLLELDSYVDTVALQTFSRKRAELCYEIISRLENSQFRLGFPDVEIGHWAIAVLILINRDCYKKVLTRLEQYTHTETDAAMPTLDVTIRHEGQVELVGQRYDINLRGLFPGLLARRFPPPSGGPELQTDTPEDLGHPEAIQLGILPGADPALLLPPVPVALAVSLRDIADIFLWTAVRLIMASNTIDSNPLLSMVKNMDDVVLVSASTSPAPIYSPNFSDDGDDSDGSDSSEGSGESDNNTGHGGEVRRGAESAEEARDTATEQREDPGPSNLTRGRLKETRQVMNDTDERVGNTGRFRRGGRARKGNPATVRIADEGESDDTYYGPDGRAIYAYSTSSDDGIGKDEPHRD